MTSVALRARPAARRSPSRATARWSVGVTLPLLALFVLFNVVPVYELAKLSLQRWADVSSGRPAPLTLDNYGRMVGDPVFWKVLWNTVLFTVVRVPLGLALGLLVALAIQRTRLFRAVSITAWFSPFMTSLVAMAVVFTYLFNPTFGLVNDLLRALGLPGQGFLTDPDQALMTIMLVDLWKNVGFNVVVFLAGLNAIPVEYYDAAKVDGASSWQTLRRITVPLLSRTTYMLLVLGVITSMRVFVPVYMMSGFSLSSGGLGGPLNSTNVLTLQMYQVAFRFGDFGYASAIAMTLFAIVMAVTILQLRLLRTTWSY
jgi:multiple sugar transport system permease protein